MFSFEKLTDVDTGLGPEMKSTGEVLGLAETYPQALLKAFKGSGMRAPKKGGRVIITVKDETGEAVNAEIVWKNEAGEVVDVAGSDDLSKYTYTLEIVAADETVEFTPNVVVTTKDGEKAFTVPGEALTDTNATVSVDETMSGSLAPSTTGVPRSRYTL